LPKRKSVRPISFMAGIPLANKNTQINKTAAIDTNAANRNTICMNISLNFCIEDTPYYLTSAQVAASPVKIDFT